MSLRIAVCDDNESVRRQLAEMLRGIAPDAEISGYAEGGALLRAGIFPDILFLDIELPGIDGLTLAGRLRERGMDGELILISGEESYVWRAFEVDALQYLRKPISREELERTYQRALEKHRRRQSSEAAERPSMLIHYRGIHEKIYLDEIVYAESYGRKVILHRMEDSVEYYGKISELEKLLGGSFFRVHRAYIINLDYVVRYGADGIVLRNGCVSVSKANYPRFVKRFLQYNAERKG